MTKTATHERNLRRFSRPRHTNMYLVVTLIFNVAKTLPHAVLTIFLLGQGISIANVALFQICFMAPIFLFEIPSGILADKLGRKPTFLLAILSMIIGFAMIGFTNAIPAIFIGQFFYGLATALMSGTIEADLLVRYRTEVAPPELTPALRRLQVKTQVVTAAGMLAGGVSGSFLFAALPQHFYAVPLGVLVLALALAVMFVPSLHYASPPRRLREQLRALRQESKVVLRKKGVLLAVLLLGSAQILTQPYFNNWPKIYADKGIAPLYFGLIYGVFQVIGIVTALLFLKYHSNRSWLKVALIIATLGIVVITLMLLRDWPFALLFPLFLIPFDLFRSTLSLNLATNLSAAHISAQTSLVSTIGRLFAALSLLINWLLLSYLPVSTALIISASLCAAVSLAMIFATTMYARGRKGVAPSASALIEAALPDADSPL